MPPRKQSEPRTTPAWVVVVPVKHTAIAKSRLAGFSPADRARLALAFARDVVTAAQACRLVSRVVVVTNDDNAASAFRDQGAEIVADRPDDGLNPALVHAERVVRLSAPESGVAALSADLPALDTETLNAAFSAAPRGRWFVTDAAQTGTTLLAAGAGHALNPSFGTNSCAAHRSSGAQELTLETLARLRRDVDTTTDLWDAVRLGVGRYTDEALALIPEAPLR
jgi:2-phospho-L-lactate/phosphoenolpyruvate guanylyltransferase